MYEITYEWANYEMWEIEFETFCGLEKDLEERKRELERDACRILNIEYIPTDEEIAEGCYDN